MFALNLAPSRKTKKQINYMHFCQQMKRRFPGDQDDPCKKTLRTPSSISLINALFWVRYVEEKSRSGYDISSVTEAVRPGGGQTCGLQERLHELSRGTWERDRQQTSRLFSDFFFMTAGEGSVHMLAVERALAESQRREREGENHSVYREWCEVRSAKCVCVCVCVCVAARGIGAQHQHRRRKRQVDQEQRGPGISSDFFFVSTHAVLAVKCSRSGRFCSDCTLDERRNRIWRRILRSRKQASRDSSTSATTYRQC